MIPWSIIIVLLRVACNPSLLMSWSGPLFPQKGRKPNAYPVFNKSCWIRSESKVTNFYHFLSLVNKSRHPSCNTVPSVVFHFYRRSNTAKTRLNLFFFFPTKDAQFSLKEEKAETTDFQQDSHSYHSYFQTLVWSVLGEPCAVRTPYIALFIQETPRHLPLSLSKMGCRAGGTVKLAGADTVQDLDYKPPKSRCHSCG